MVVDWAAIHDLLSNHRYQDALAAYHEGRQQEPERGESTDIGARALLCLGHLDAALAEFTRHNEVYRQKSQDRDQPSLIAIGVTNWLLGRRTEGMRILHEAVEGILSGRIHYGDNAGGVSQGLVLWYMGLTSKDAPASEYALTYLRILADRPRIEFWPGPLALFALNRISVETLLTQVVGTADRQNCIRAAKTDLLKRRYLCRIFFYSGVSNRSRGDETACYRDMQSCIALENPIIEDEWYLARAEVATSELMGSEQT